VTLEDLLEMLVGDIDDEHDEADGQNGAAIVADGDGWIVDGRTPLEELEEAYRRRRRPGAADLDERIDTVAGLLNALAGRVPAEARGDRATPAAS
jgi:CBS domain containing-hemolysin-like protein